MQQSCLLIVIVLRRAKNSMGKLQHLPSSTQCTQANRHPLKEWEVEPIQIKQQFPIQLSCKYECLLSQNVNSKLHMCFFVKLSPLGLNCSLLLACFSSPCLPFCSLCVSTALSWICMIITWLLPASITLCWLDILTQPSFVLMPAHKMKKMSFWWEYSEYLAKIPALNFISFIFELAATEVLSHACCRTQQMRNHIK